MIRRSTVAGMLALLCAGAGARDAMAQVDVEIIGNTAHAVIALQDEGGQLHQADVTITFAAPQSLTVASLGLAAELFDPASKEIAARLPAGIQPAAGFPLMITVEPPAVTWLFRSGFDGEVLPAASLAFHDTYDIEITTPGLDAGSHVLLKAPLGGAFTDITSDAGARGEPGLHSARARGRGGAFSQFMIGTDQRVPLVVALEKLVALDLRLLGAVLDELLRLDLAALIVQINSALLVPLVGCDQAQQPLAQFRASVAEHSGNGIANTWRAERDLVNDAGELESLAATLQFTLLQCAGR